MVSPIQQELVKISRAIQHVQDKKEILELVTEARNLLLKKDREAKQSCCGNDVTFAAGQSGLDREKLKQVVGIATRTPYRLFPSVLLKYVFGKLDAEERDVFFYPYFLEADAVDSVAHLALFLSQTDSKEDVETGHIVFKKIVDSGRFASIVESHYWQDRFPSRNWEQCCEEIIGWLVSFPQFLSRFGYEPHEQFETRNFYAAQLQLLFSKTIESHRKEEMSYCLLGMFMKRLIFRGFGNLILETLLKHSLPKMDIKNNQKSHLALVKSIRDPHAIEKFYDLFLHHLDFEQDPYIILKLFVLKDPAHKIDEEIGYILFSRILQQTELSMKLSACMVELLCLHSEQAMTITAQIATTWTCDIAVHQVSLPRQAYFTFLLQRILPHFENSRQKVLSSRFYRMLMEGVSQRLGHCLDVVKYQGMRIAQSLAALEPGSKPPFEDIEIDYNTLQPEEQWEKCQSSKQSPDPVPSALSTTKEVVFTPKMDPTDSDDESDFCSSVVGDDNLGPGDLSEEMNANPKRGERPVTLVDLLQDLKLSEDRMKVISALKQLMTLMKQNHPKELTSLAPEFTRSLVFLYIPDWVGEELQKDDAMELKGLKSAPEVRVFCLQRLMEQVPLQSGQTSAQLLSSSQLAMHQRLEILESMRKAAISISSPPAVPHLEFPSESSRARDGKTRVWGVKSLELEKRRELQSSWRNPFHEVVGLWATNLLNSAQEMNRGCRLMERDHRVLGALIITLGTFVECVANSFVSVSLSLFCFPLLKAVLEKQSENCFLRRCAYQSLMAVIKGLPISRLASHGLDSLVAPVQEVDRNLQTMLVWIKEKAKKAMESDHDETTRMLASGCFVALHESTRKALEAQASSSPSAIQINREIKVPKKPSFNIRAI